MPKETNPAREQPAGNEGARQDVTQFPGEESEQPFRRRGANDRVSQREKPIMQRADEKEPGKAEGMSPNELPMRPQGRAQTFVVQDERNLHGGKSK